MTDVKPQIPSVYDLHADPAETQNLMDTDLTVTWLIGQAMRPLVELSKSAAQFPHVLVGANFAGYD
jgi:hypothetical protein